MKTVFICKNVNNTRCAIKFPNFIRYWMTKIRKKEKSFTLDTFPGVIQKCSLHRRINRWRSTINCTHMNWVKMEMYTYIYMEPYINKIYSVEHSTQFITSNESIVCSKVCHRKFRLEILCVLQPKSLDSI